MIGNSFLSSAAILWTFINLIYCQYEHNDTIRSSTIFPTPPRFSDDIVDSDVDQQQFIDDGVTDDVIIIQSTGITNNNVNNQNSNNSQGSLNFSSVTISLSSTSSSPLHITTTSKSTSTSTTTTTTSMDLPKLQFEPFVQFHQLNFIKNSSSTDKLLSSSNDRGMWILYQVTDWFLERVQPNDFPDYLLTDDDLKSLSNLLLSLKQNHKQWIKYQQGFIITAGICLLLTLVFTICYIFYLCCCRCFWRETNEKLRDKRRDRCRRNCCNGVLTVLVLAMTFAIVCAFISNQFVHVAVSNLPKNLRLAADDLTMYKDETNQRFKKLLSDDFRLVNRTFASALNAFSGVLVERLKQTTGASALDRLASISDKANKFINDLNSIENSLPQLEMEVAHFRNNLTKIRLWVADELYKCINGDDTVQKTECEIVVSLVGFSKNVPEKFVSMSKHFEHVKEQLLKIAAYQLSSKFAGAQRQFDDLKNKIDDNIGNNKKVVVNQMNEFGKSLDGISSNITREIQEVDISSAKIYIDDYENDLLNYEFYRYVGGYVCAGILALLILCLGFGLIYGVCGRRPGFYEDDCCVWTRGGRLYCGAVVLGVLFILPFMVGTIGLFLIGGNGQAIVCRSLENPNEQSGFLNIVQRLIDIMKTTSDIRRDSALREILQENKLSTVINGCSEKKTLYNILSFEKHYRIFNLKDNKPEVYRQLNSYFDQTQTVNNVKMTFDIFIPNDVETTLNEVYKITVHPVAAKLIDELKTNASLFDLEEKVKQLKILTTSNNLELQNLLRTLIPTVETLRKDLANSINRKFLFMIDNLTSINAHSTNLTKNIPAWILSVKNAQGLLNNNLISYLQNSSRFLIKDIQSYFDTYFERLKRQLETEVTSCEPIQQSLWAAISFVCDDALHPFNGFWTCIAVCLILSVPSIILASALRDLYANTDPYVSGDSQANASAWRTPANSMYFDDSNRPPPPYRSPPGRHK